MLLVEAVFTSAWVKLSLKFFNFKQIMRWLGGVNIETDNKEQPANLQLRRDVATALQLCNKYTFWPTECYTLALTGKLLLKRRHVASTLYIGFMKDEGKIKGHAWLRAAETYICGYREAGGFTVHSVFS